LTRGGSQPPPLTITPPLPECEPEPFFGVVEPPDPVPGLLDDAGRPVDGLLVDVAVDVVVAGGALTGCEVTADVGALGVVGVVVCAGAATMLV
jgi:hypothetical protein